MKVKKKAAITSTRFVISVILIMAGTVLFTSFMTRMLFKYGFLKHGSYALIFIYFLVTSSMVGAILATIVARKFISPMIKIALALNLVADGDFSVTINEKFRTREVAEMARSFNIMTSELRNTEIIHNDFITNVSHEFKTPLSAIEGYAELLQNEKLSSEKRDAYADKIIFNTKRLSALTDNVLLLSKLDNQEIIIQRTIFPLDEQIRQIVLLFENEWTNKNIEMDIQLDELSYCGNVDLLSHVWQNLIGNAVKFTVPDGKIKIKLKKETGEIKFIIKDNGPGISEKTKARIFEKFYQGDTSHAAKGNGLGLSLAKKIVDLHEGKIEVESEPGEGTTFIVTLTVPPRIIP